MVCVASLIWRLKRGRFSYAFSHLYQRACPSVRHSLPRIGVEALRNSIFGKVRTKEHERVEWNQWRDRSGTSVSRERIHVWNSADCFFSPNAVNLCLTKWSISMGCIFWEEVRIVNFWRLRTRFEWREWKGTSSLKEASKQNARQVFPICKFHFPHLHIPFSPSANSSASPSPSLLSTVRFCLFTLFCYIHFHTPAYSTCHISMYDGSLHLVYFYP